MGDCRPTISGLGESYGDRLKIEAFVAKTTLSGIATTIMKSALDSRAESTDKKLDLMARKRGITLEKLINLVLLDKAEHLTDEGYKRMIEKQEGSVEIELELD